MKKEVGKEDGMQITCSIPTHFEKKKTTKLLEFNIINGSFNEIQSGKKGNSLD